MQFAPQTVANHRSEQINFGDEFSQSDISDGTDYGGSGGKKSNKIKAKSKKGGKSMGCYSMLKVFNSLLYSGTLLLAFGYFATMKFTSDFVYYSFLGLLIGRPAMIVLYSIIVMCIESQRRPAKGKKSKKELSDDSEFELSDVGGDFSAQHDYMNNSYISQNKIHA